MAAPYGRRKMPFSEKVGVGATIATLMISSGCIGLGIGYKAMPVKIETETVTVTERVEVPVYFKEDKVPMLKDVFLYDIPVSDNLQRYIYEICEDEKLPVSLILAIIEHESGFNPDAVSVTDDYGLMQINAINHEWLEEEYRTSDMLNPYQNVFAGVKIIGSYVRKYSGDFNKALMAYAMGEYGARKAWANGVTSIGSSTEILKLMEKYEEVARNGHDS